MPARKEQGIQAEQAAEGGIVRPEASSSTGSRGENPRRRALSFVIVFLACTFGLLVGYRYAGGTTFMDWYLFQIAQQTSAVLSVFGDSSTVENTVLLQPRRAEIREELRTLTGGEASATDESPLTSWEAWRYRALKSRRTLREAEDALAQFTSVPWNPPADPAERVKYLRDRVARIRAGLEPPGATGAALPAETASAVRRLDAALGAAESGGASLPEVEAQILAMEKQTALFMEQRVVQMAAQSRDDGPRVAYVARAGVERRIRVLNQQMEAVKADGSLDAAAKRKTVSDLQAKVEALQADAGSDTRKDSAFTFRVVADCGAIPSMTIFMAAVIAFPAAWRKRLIGVLVGVPILYAINIFRLACLGVLGAWKGPGPLFDFAHHYVWQGIYIVFVVAVWLLWVEFVVRGRQSWQKEKAAS